MKYIPYIPPYDRIPYGFCPADEDKETNETEAEENMEEFMDPKATPTDLIQVVQLPVIREQLKTLKEAWEQRAADAEAMVCNEDTIQAVKKFRSDINKEFESVELLRKAVKQAVLEPYNQFEAVYKECVTLPKKAAENNLTRKVNQVEAEQKRICEDRLRDYFTELCAAHHLDWLKYEQADIRIDMASAKAKTPKKLREQLVQFIVHVAESVEHISAMDNADEIMVEFQRTLDASSAIFIVQKRHEMIEKQKEENEVRKAAKIVQEAMERKVDESYQKYLQPPTEAFKMPESGDEEIIPRCTFTALNATRTQLRKLKEFLKEEGIQYE